MRGRFIGGLCLAAVVFMGIAAPRASGQERRATLAVLPFYVDATQQITFGNQVIRPEVVEHDFTNQLIAFLVKSRKFNVLERTRVEKIIDENRLTESDWAAPGQEERIGKLLVADYLIIGNIDRLEFQVTPVEIAITGERSTNVVATFRTQFRAVEVATGKVTFAQTLTERVRSRDIRKEVPNFERKDWTMADYRDFLFKKAVVRAGNAILGGIYPVRIASVGQGDVILNRGEGAGIHVGDRYEIFNVGSEIVDPDTGESLGSEEFRTGVIEVTSIEPKFSKARVIGPVADIAVGAICRPMETQEEAPATEFPRATPGW